MLRTLVYIVTPGVFLIKTITITFVIDILSGLSADIGCRCHSVNMC